MEKIVIEGGQKLNGTVEVSGAKNSALPIMFATLLADGEHVLKNVPNLADIRFTAQLLHALGCETEFSNNTMKIQVKEAEKTEAHYDIVRKMRASILCLGPLLARYGEAVVSLPGGCAIGTRPIDQHLEGLIAMGVEVDTKEGYVYAKTSGKKLQGTNIVFDGVTVGGTENILMAATLAEGETRIENAAKEPEIVDLANYLNKMGAKVEGAGTSTMTVVGVDSLKPSEHSIIPDRIEAGTLLIAGAISGGTVTIRRSIPQHMDAFLAKLKECGFEVEVMADSITVKGQPKWSSADVTTAAFPGFATDLQAQFTALMTQAEGTSVVTETIFENRFMHIQELNRLNADVTPKTKVAIVRGNPGQLQGAPVMATDLRASACLILAGLVAKGETQIKRVYHLDRGYEGLDTKLARLGAKIRREKDI
jgi:UDP-N-acetylglucosamine 1-carboxyvinyltransferase